MAQTTLDEKKIKELFKQATLELLQERKDLLYDVFAEVIEHLSTESPPCPPHLKQKKLNPSA